MNEKITPLEERIAKFESLLEEMKESIRESHSTLKEMRNERREIERLLSSKELKQMVNDRVNDVVKTELDKIGPEIRAQTNRIYDKVGEQIDKLIDLSMGKEFAVANNREDIRPQLAEKLRVWIREIIER
jgi:chromosome segregation ATPase